MQSDTIMIQPQTNTRNDPEHRVDRQVNKSREFLSLPSKAKVLTYEIYFSIVAGNKMRQNWPKKTSKHSCLVAVKELKNENDICISETFNSYL